MDQQNKGQNQGSHQDDWKKNNPNQQNQQGGQQQGGQQQGGQQKNPQADRDMEQKRKQA